MSHIKRYGRPQATTVSNKALKENNLTMKLIYVFVAVLALSLAEESEIADSEAVATMELLKLPGDEILEPAASAHSYVSNTKSWNSQNYIPPQNNYVPPVSNYVPPVSNYVPPVSNYVPPVSNYVPPVSNYVPPTNNYVPPTNNYVPPSNNYVPPTNNYVPPSNNYVPPTNNYVPPVNNNVPPQNDYAPPQNSYVPPQNNYYPPNVWTTNSPTWTTTASPVIKNELIYGDNGSYKYEYQIADGTHVGETGYYTNPQQNDESLVKKGWYSFVGADGKTYTVHYWADHTGYHAYGDHLPTPSPAVQAALDKAEAEKNKQPTYYPTQPPYNQNQQPTYGK